MTAANDYTRIDRRWPGDHYTETEPLVPLSLEQAAPIGIACRYHAGAAVAQPAAGRAGVRFCLESL